MASLAAWWRCVLIGALTMLSVSNPTQAQDAPPAPKAAVSEGVLDEIQITGNTLKARGWAGAGNSANPVAEIRLLVDGVEIYSGSFQKQQRPDVAKAKGRPDWLESGWSINAPLSNTLPDSPRKITATATLKNGDRFDLSVPAERVTLASPTSNSSRPVDKPAPPKAGNSIIAQIVWLALALLAGLAGWLGYQKYKLPTPSTSVEPDAPAPFQKPDRVTILILAGVFFSIFASKLFLIANFGSGIPYWDQWGSEAKHLLIPFLEGRLLLADLFSPHNEHRIALTRLLVLVLFVLNGQWDPMVAMVAQAALHAGILSLFIALFAKILDRYTWSLFALIGSIFYCLPFSWENTLWGFQSQFYFSTLCGLLGIWLTSRCRYFSHGWIYGLTFFILGLFTMGSTFLAASAALGVGIVRVFVEPGHKLRAMLALVAFSIVMASGLFLVGHNPGHDPLKAKNASDFFGFFFQLAAWPTTVPILGLLLHLPLLATASYVLLRRPPSADFSWGLATLGCWNFLGMAALAYGRANSDLASRYTDGLAFGLLVSLACAFWLYSRLKQRWKLLALWLILTQVICIAGGVFYQFSSKLLDQIYAKKALETYQSRNLISFLSKNNILDLSNKPFLHVPYPNAHELAQILRQKSLRDALPVSLQLGAVPDQIAISENSFLADSGVYQTTTPNNTKPHFGSFTQAGDTSTGELRLEYPDPPAASRLSLAVSGYPLKDDMELFLETEDGKKIPIPIAANPRETWQEVVFKNPGVPFSIVAVDGSPTTWLAIGLPTPIGRLSVLTQWLLANWWIFGAAGVGCFVGFALINGSKYLGHEDAC